MKFIDRLAKAREELQPFYSDYRVVYEDNVDEPVKIMKPDAHAMAALMAGNVFPPIWTFWELQKDASQPDFKKHTRGHLLHDTPREGPKTEKEALEFIIMKDVPQHVWRVYNEGNRPKMVICRKQQLPKTREWRNAWRLAA